MNSLSPLTRHLIVYGVTMRNFFRRPHLGQTRLIQDGKLQLGLHYQFSVDQPRQPSNIKPDMSQREIEIVQRHFAQGYFGIVASINGCDNFITLIANRAEPRISLRAAIKSVAGLFFSVDTI